jgi:hypothetical protein
VNRLIRILFVLLFVYLTGLAVVTVQYYFDRGDLKKASQVLFEFRPQGKETLALLMSQKLMIQESQLKCESQLLSRYEGRVRVLCGSVKKPQHFVFDVDVVGYSIQAINSVTKNLFTKSPALQSKDPS